MYDTYSAFNEFFSVSAIQEEHPKSKFISKAETCKAAVVIHQLRKEHLLRHHQN